MMIHLDTFKIKIYVQHWFSTRGNFVFQGTFGNVWSQFGFHSWMGVLLASSG